MNLDFDKILRDGVSITSSGTTGTPKTIFRSPENLKECIKVALLAQEITPESRILTVTRTTHAGGLLLQSLPCYTLGCELKIQKFNPYTFLKDIEHFTHTFLTPEQMIALTKTKNFKSCDLTGKRILGGSDPVSWELIEAFVEKGAILQPNWGMSEIGPTTINAVFDNLEKVTEYKKICPKNATILGDTFWCETKIENSELIVRSPMCVYDGWFSTGDRVEMRDGVMFYLGRKDN